MLANFHFYTEKTVLPSSDLLQQIPSNCTAVSCEPSLSQSNFEDFQ